MPIGFQQLSNRLLCRRGAHSGLSAVEFATPYKNGAPRRAWFRSTAAAAATFREESHEQYSIMSLPLAYLRAMDRSNFDPATLQRSDVPVDAASGKKALATDGPCPGRNNSECRVKHITKSSDSYRIFWDDGLESVFSLEWMDRQRFAWKGDAPTLSHSEAGLSTRTLWTELTEATFRDSVSMDFDRLVTDEGMKQALRYLYEYGILLVANTPVDDNGVAVAAMASALGGGAFKNPTTLLHQFRASKQDGGGVIMLPKGTDGPLRTLYGTVWSTTSTGPHGQNDGTSVADSAYGQDGLPLHTDMTYMRDPPGLQIFTMVQPAPPVPGRERGTSTYCDGFAAAERLRQTNLAAFEMLSSVIRTYRSFDADTGWHLEAEGPVLTVRNGRVVAVRHNDLDRLPDLPPPEMTPTQALEYYDRLRDSHTSWDEILNDDEFRLEVNLQRGDTVVVANQVRAKLFRK
jgi:alpha-ketoglutarate-dependent taurine dioxygenase